MLFLTYKPKTAKNVKAEKIATIDVAQEIAESFNGTARVSSENGESILMIATLTGVLQGRIGQWVVRQEDGVIIMDDVDFTRMYERARTIRES